METLKIIVLVLDLISAILLTATILIQSGKSAGLSGAIAGSSDSFMAKGGSKTLDTKLAKATKWIGLAFVLLSLLSVILVSSAKASATTTPAETEAPVVTTEAAIPTGTVATTEAAVITTETADTTEATNG